MKSDFVGVFNPSIDVSVIADDIITVDDVVDEFDHRFEMLHKDCALGCSPIVNNVIGIIIRTDSYVMRGDGKIRK